MTMAIYVLAGALAGCGLVYADRDGEIGRLGTEVLRVVAVVALLGVLGGVVLSVVRVLL